MNGEPIVLCSKTMPARLRGIRTERVERKRYAGTRRIEAVGFLRLFGPVDEIGRPAIGSIAGVLRESLGETETLDDHLVKPRQVVFVVLKIQPAFVGGRTPI